MTELVRTGLLLAGGLLLVACDMAGGSVTQGTGGTAVTGSAAGASSVGADPSLERCSETLGTLAIDDGREEYWYGEFVAKTQVSSVEPMIRTIVQQSNCFVVTTAGNTRLVERIERIKDRTRSGEFRANSNYQKGQAIASDYYLEPSILYSQSDAGGLGGAVGGLLGGSLGGVLGGAMTNQSHTTVNLTLVGLREEAQIAASEGSATSNDLGAFLGGFGGGAAGGLAGYTKTPEGKATVAAFVDAYNKMVVALKGYQAQTVKGGLGTGGTLKMGQ